MFDRRDMKSTHSQVKILFVIDHKLVVLFHLLLFVAFAYHFCCCHVTPLFRCYENSIQKAQKNGIKWEILLVKVICKTTEPVTTIQFWIEIFLCIKVEITCRYTSCTHVRNGSRKCKYFLHIFHESVKAKKCWM